MPSVWQSASIMFPVMLSRHFITGRRRDSIRASHQYAGSGRLGDATPLVQKDHVRKALPATLDAQARSTFVCRVPLRSLPRISCSMSPHAKTSFQHYKLQTSAESRHTRSRYRRYGRKAKYLIAPLRFSLSCNVHTRQSIADLVPFLQTSQGASPLAYISSRYCLSLNVSMLTQNPS
jgi:hypothetical protein